MPIRGESVGAAYVRILVDGSHVPEGIRDAMDRETFEKTGRTSGKNFRKGFDDELEQHPSFTHLRDSLLRGAGKMEAVGNFLGGKTMDGLEDTLRKRLGPEIGARVAKDFREQIRNGLDPKDLEDQLEHRLLPAAKRAMRKFEQEWRSDTDDITKDTQRLARGIGRDLGNIQTSLRTTGEHLSRFRLNAIKDVSNFSKTVEKEGKTSTSWFNKLAHDMDVLGDGLGTTFGRGSRNNFINFFGSLIRNVVRVVAVVPRLLGTLSDGITGVGKEFAKGFSQARTAGDGFFKSVLTGALTAEAAIGEMLSTGLVGLIAFAAAAVIAAAAIGPLVSILSGLLAAVTALAASLSFAVVGALAPLVGLIAPLGAAVAGLGLAFVGLNDKAKKALKESIKPVTDGLKSLGAEVRKGLFSRLNEDTKAMGTAFKSLEPLFRGVGKAIADVVHMMLAELNGPGGQAFIRDMTTFIPGAIRDLGEIFTHTLGGFGGVFRALIPLTQTFLEWLEKITFKFANFTNSARGQTALKKFFDDAATSARSVWGLIKSIGNLLGTLFGAGRKTGDTIIDQLSRKVREFNNYLQAHPNAVRDWFANGKKTIEDLGNLVNQLSRIIRRLDTPENREIAHLIFGTMITLARGASHAVTLLLGPMHLVMKAAEHMGDIFRAVYNHSIGPVLSEFLHRLAALERNFGQLLVAIGRFVPGAAKMGHALIAASKDADRLASSVRNIKDRKVTVKVDTGRARNDIDGLQSRINALHGKSVDMVVHQITIYNKPKGPAPGSGGNAAGGLVASAQRLLVGEDGPEAIVPLRRNLSRVDPAVRWLSAIAQGKGMPTTNNNGKTVNVGGINIYEVSQDPRAVASEMMNRLVAVTY